MLHFLICVPALFVSLQAQQEKIPKFEDWKEFKEGNLTVKLPSKPKLNKQTVKHPVLGDIEVKVYSCEISNEAALLVSEVKYNVEPEEYNVEAGLKGAVQGMFSQAKGKLKSEKKIELNGINGKEVSGTVPSGFSIKGRIYIDGDGPTLIQFQAIGKGNFLESEAVKNFFKSVDLKPIKPKKQK